jgi:hypothetical protein
MPYGRIETSGTGQLFKSGEPLCNVTFTYVQIGNPEGGHVRTDGELLVEESKRKSPEVLGGIHFLPIELRTDAGEILEIVVMRAIGNVFDGRYIWILWDGGDLIMRQIQDRNYPFVH